MITSQLSAPGTAPERPPLSETTAHYDIEPTFFQKFLDPKYLKYSSGFFLGKESQEEAARNMLDKLVDFLSDRKRPQVLEIGPGWGAFPRRLKERGIPCDYTAVNPSRAQNAFIRSHVDSSLHIIENTFENTSFSEGHFDFIYFIGSLCHMRNLDVQLTKLHALLAPGGTLVIEDVFFLNSDIFSKHDSRPETQFVQLEVFGYAHILALSQFVDLASANNLHIKTLLENTNGYRDAIASWLPRLRILPESAMRDQFIQHLEIAQRGWGYTIGTYLISLQKGKRLSKC